MKTVMKKMFSLMLVAVLLVSAVPFAASAEEMIPLDLEPGEYTVDENFINTYYTGSGTPTRYYVHNGALQGETFTAIVERDYFLVIEAVADEPAPTPTPEQHTHVWADATCTTPKTCKDPDCGETEGNALGHTPGDAATCTTAQTCTVCKETLAEALNHSYGNDTVCDTCGFCNACQATLDKNDAGGFDASSHDETCPHHPNYNRTCTKCGTEYTAAETHPTCEHCNNVLASTSNKCHATANCPYCKVCLKTGSYVTNHKTAAHCEECGNTDGTHKVTCSDYESSGNALVRIHVRLYNANTHIDTVELLTYRDDKGTQIGDSVSAHKSLIYAELADQYPDYTWGGNLYDDPGESQDYNEQIGEGTTVYINAYANQDMVLIYVHNSRSFNNLRIIQLEGKRKGDTVTKKEVTNAVSKYYNVSSLSMYSEDAWEAYVDGENVESVSSLKIPEDDSYYVIDVKISGTAKSGTSSSSTADSSNPKTGDEIFAPVAILGASASALAVLFYLNKKRAY